jgi:hypothetical protein
MKTVTGMGGMGGARELAEMLRQMGRGPDTVLAHITPEEAEMLMQMGGSGNINPNTGLPEFQPYDYEYDAYVNAPQQMAPPPPLPMPDSTDYMAQARAAEPVGYYGTSQTGFNQAVDRYAGQNFDLSKLSDRQRYDITDPNSQLRYGPTGFTDFAYTGQDEGLRDFVDIRRGDIGFGPGQYAPPVSRADIAGMPQAQVDQLIGQQPSMISQAAGALEGGMSDIRQTLSKYPNLSAVLATGAQSLPALLNARRMQRETERSAAELRALGAPLRQQGEALRQQALAGRLTPQQAAAQEAARARLRQGAATRGVTTGTQQAMIENQLASSRAAQSEVNLNNALKQLNLANAYDEAAIRAKLAGDREIADILSTVAGNIASGVASQAPRRQTAAAPTQRTSPMPEEPITRRPEVRS